MRAWGIAAVVNMRAEADDAAHGLALEHYLWLPTVDDAVPSLEELQRGVDFIATQIAAGRGVYIHCAAGVGRAPLMAAAYLLYWDSAQCRLVRNRKGVSSWPHAATNLHFGAGGLFGERWD